MLLNICFIVWWFYFSQMISALKKDNANSFAIFQFVSKTQRTQLKFFSENFFFLIDLLFLTFSVAWQHTVSMGLFFLKMYILKPQQKVRKELEKDVLRNVIVKQRGRHYCYIYCHKTCSLLKANNSSLILYDCQIVNTRFHFSFFIVLK